MAFRARSDSTELHLGELQGEIDAILAGNLLEPCARCGVFWKDHDARGWCAGFVP